VVAAGNDRAFKGFCRALGRPEWAEDARFRTNPDRVGHAEILYGMIEPEMLRHGNAEWQRRIDAEGVPCAPVQNAGQMLEHEQTRALGLLQQVPGSSIPIIGLPVSINGRRPEPRSAPPALGADTAEVFANTARKAP